METGMGKKTTTKSDWKDGTRNVNETYEDDEGNKTTTHYKEESHALFPNSVTKTGSSSSKNK